MTEEELREIEARANAATPGPWRCIPGVLKHYVGSENGDLTFSIQELHPDDGRDVPARQNATFIAHAREDVPRLVAEVRALRERLREVERERDDVCRLLHWLCRRLVSSGYDGRGGLYADVDRLTCLFCRWEGSPDTEPQHEEDCPVLLARRVVGEATHGEVSQATRGG